MGGELDLEDDGFLCNVRTIVTRDSASWPTRLSPITMFEKGSTVAVLSHPCLEFPGF